MSDGEINEPSAQDLLFDKFSESCLGHTPPDVVTTCLGLIVTIAEDSDQKAFVRSTIVAMMQAAIYIRENFLNEKDEPVIQLLN